MIDFPASPTNLQVFGAPNGVVYQYSTANSAWLAQNPAPQIGGTGDFCANQTSSFPTISTTFTTLILTQVYSGNAGLWYSTSTGRYTPPAGRFSITASFSGACGAASHYYLQLRKNGAVVQQSVSTEGTATWFGEVSVSLTVDANGADFFDIQGQSTGGAVTPNSLVFSAFPLTGMQGPTGGAPGPVVGDFCAIGSATLATTNATLIGMPVVVGNSGGYYTSGNGQWKPPSGRFQISASMIVNNSAVLFGVGMSIRKNGTAIQSAQIVQGPNYANTMSATVIADANGSDIFDVQANGTATTTASQVTFLAFPTQGMVGPQGPQGPAGSAPTVVVTTVFTASGTWTPNAKMVYARVQGWGAGGAGGSCASASANIGNAAGGGAAGSWAKVIISKAVAGASQTVTIGAAAAQPASGNVTGGVGGDTSLGALLIAKGGAGGAGQTAGGNTGLGGLGVVAGNVGDETGPGMSGGSGGSSNLGGAAAPSAPAPTNHGGSAIPIGSGGRGVNSLSGQGNGENAIGFASGGSGAMSYSTGVATRGAVGTGGYLVIEEYCTP